MRPSVDNQLLDEPAPAAEKHGEWRELASRRSGAISVGLYWHANTDEVAVHVTDEQTGEEFVLARPSILRWRPSTTRSG